MLVAGDNVPINRRIVALIFEKVLKTDMREVAVEKGDDNILSSVESGAFDDVLLLPSLKPESQQHNADAEDKLPHALLDTGRLLRSSGTTP